MKIANIIYEDELVNHDEIDYVNYHRITEESPKEDVKKIDLSLPTLIVGWKFLKKRFPNITANILDHKIFDKKLYWEFSFSENKSSHVNGVQNFVDNIPNFYYSSQYEYINLDPIFFNIRDNSELFDILPKEMDSIYFYKQRMLYILSNKKIYGLDIEMYNFFKFNIQGMINKIHDLTKHSYIDDSEGKYHKEYYKQFPEFSYLKRYLVVILSK